MPPNALPSTDSAQLLELIAARKLLDEATRGGVEVDLDRVDVVLGVASATELVVQMGSWMQRPIWRKAMLEDGLPEDEAEEICRDIADLYPAWQESTFPGLLVDVVAGRIANRLDLGGSNFVVDAACASSLLALQASLHRLYLHESDMVLTGRVDALNDVMMFMCFSKTPAFSPTGDRRPFSDAADGTIVGEGVGRAGSQRLCATLRPDSGVSAWPAASARWRSSPTRKSCPASCAAANPHQQLPGAVPALARLDRADPPVQRRDHIQPIAQFGDRGHSRVAGQARIRRADTHPPARTSTSAVPLVYLLTRWVLTSGSTIKLQQLELSYPATASIANFGACPPTTPEIGSDHRRGAFQSRDGAPVRLLSVPAP